MGATNCSSHPYSCPPPGPRSAGNALFPRRLLGFRGGPGGNPQGGRRRVAPPCHFHRREDATRSREPCPVSCWHAQTREHLALPGPSLAEHLKTVCGNSSRPPGLRASTLRILQGENTETEKLASLWRATQAHSQAPCPQCTSSPPPAGVGLETPSCLLSHAEGREAANTHFQCKGRTPEQKGGLGDMTA